jgi:serine phosphatase RsbU (regulator of sigma subunit)
VVKIKIAAISSPLQPNYGGDAYYIKKLPGKVLITVIDALGHGQMAQKAANRALELLASFDEPEPDLNKLLNSMHKALISTVGVVLGLALIDHSCREITFAGIGNITIKIIGPKKFEIFLPGGILGYQADFSFQKTITFSPEDILLMHTDGIIDDYRFHSFPPEAGLAPQQIVQSLMSCYRRPNDDALVLAASELGVEGYEEQLING